MERRQFQTWSPQVVNLTTDEPQPEHNIDRTEGLGVPGTPTRQRREWEHRVGRQHEVKPRT
jgi:hypothetical protein